MKSDLIEDKYPLSPMQHGMLFHSLYMPESGVYIQQKLWTLQETINIAALLKALTQVVGRYPVLRTSFHIADTEDPFQAVHRQVDVPFQYYDLRGQDENEQTTQYSRYVETDIKQGFQLDAAPLMRFAVFQILDNLFKVVWTFHHALLDGRSDLIILKEIFLFYESFSNGSDMRLESPKPYKDYILWIATKDAGETERFWKDRLKGFQQATPVGTGNYLGKSDDLLELFGKQYCTYTVKETTAFMSFAKKHGITVNTLIQGAWAILLSRYSDQDDIVFGTTRACRHIDIEGIESMAGLFINTLPVRILLSPEREVLSWLKEIRQMWIDVRDHENASLVDIHKWSDIQPGSSLFDSIIVFENYAVNDVLRRSGNTWEKRTFFTNEQPDEPLTIFGHLGKELTIGIAYKTSCFDTAIINRMIGHFKTVLEKLINHPHLCLGSVSILTIEEQHQLDLWNSTETDFPEESCIHELFENQVVKTPNSIAAFFEQTEITYDVLNKRSNQLARYLRRQGVDNEKLVGVYMERSFEMVIGLMAILKAGGAFVPLDPSSPKEQHQYMIVDAQLEVVISQERLAEDLQETNVNIVCIDNWDAITNENSGNLKKTACPTNLAYVIYTSGSTGRPKGVMIEHRNVVNILHSFIQTYELKETDRILQQTTISFDVSVNEIFPVLCVGGAIVLPGEFGVLNFEDLSRRVKKHGVTIFSAAPSLLSQINASGHRFSDIRLILSGGEKLTVSDIRQLLQTINVVNGYGPTETTICATSYHLDHDSSDAVSAIPIGKPLANYHVYILDRQLQCLPVGYAGELCIGGVGLARGYLNAPELTAEKFIAHPFRLGQRLYRTGDLAKWLSDGNIEFLGRIDRQVKLRGFRIEPGEIETALNMHQAVQEAVVTDHEALAGDKRIAAYIVPDKDCALPVRQLSRFMAEGRLRDEAIYVLPNGMAIVHQNEGETISLYREIFEDQFHLGEGINLNDGDCIFDVGANIGLFTLFIHQLISQPKIYAFEPIPPIFKLLTINKDLYGLDAAFFAIGLSDRESTEIFTYFPQAGSLSGIFSKSAELDSQKEDIRKAITNYLMQKTDHVKSVMPKEELMDVLLPDDISMERFECQVKTISTVIREQNIETIDLLKIDVENAELNVLSGIESNHWKKIRQIVVEVHDASQLETIETLLQSEGYSITSYRKAFSGYSDVVLTNIFAVRPSDNKNHPIPKTDRRNVWNNPGSLISDLRSYLSEKLPKHMIPSDIVILDKLPLTISGKVDFHALPLPETIRYRNEHTFIAPQKPTEKSLAKIWCHLLKIEEIGIQDNFFELGGHSLLAIQIISKIRLQYPVKPSLRSFFDAPTLAEQAEIIEELLAALPGESITV